MRVGGPVGRALKQARVALKNPAIEALCGLAALGLDRVVRAPEDLDAAPPRNILVIRADRIGDLLNSSPLIAALKQKWPEAQVTLVGGPRNRAVAPLMPYARRAPVEFERHPMSWLRLRRWVRAQGFDLAVSLRSEVASGGFIAAWSRAPVRAVVEATRTLPAFNLVFVAHDHHHVRRYWTAAARLGVRYPECRPVIEIPAAAAAKAEAFLRGLAVPAGAALVGVGIPNRASARYRRKAWSADRLQELVRRVVADGARVLLLGIGQERVEAERVCGAVPGVVVAPPMSLAEVAAVQRHLSLFVSSFTGTLHVADGAGTPTLAIGETTDAANWHPIGALHRYVAARRPAAIPVEQVHAALRACLEAAARGGLPASPGGR